jgi:hypothetical protein
MFHTFAIVINVEFVVHVDYSGSEMVTLVIDDGTELVPNELIRKNTIKN